MDEPREDAPPEPVPVLLLSAEVRGQTYRCITPVPALDWFGVSAAAVVAMKQAHDAAHARGLPSPKVDRCTWKGGWVTAEP